MSKVKQSKIKQLLKHAGVTQRDIAASINVKPQFVNQVVMGKRSTDRVVAAIAIAIGRQKSDVLSIISSDLK